MARAPNPGAELCPCCGRNHILKQCREFHQQLSNEERRELLEANSRCLICFMDDHGTDDCLVRRLCSLCRRRHNQWVHTPEDDLEASFVGHSLEEEEPEYEWVYEPGLTGECLGEGFVALEEAEDVEEEDELHYAYAAFEANAVGEGEPLRRSPRNRGRPGLNYRALARGRGTPPGPPPTVTNTRAVTPDEGADHRRGRHLGISHSRLPFGAGQSSRRHLLPERQLQDRGRPSRQALGEGRGGRRVTFRYKRSSTDRHQFEARSQ